MQATGTVSSAGEGAFSVHLPQGPIAFAEKDAAIAALETHLREDAAQKVRAAGVEDIRFAVNQDIKEIQIEGRSMFIEATLRVEASGRPRIASLDT